MARPPLYTIGYQGASLRDFVASLSAAGVATLVDVRYQPFSRRPEFRQGPLAAALRAAGIAYRHEKRLGNPPASRDAAKSGDAARYRALFQAHLDAPDTRAALADLAALADAAPVALMCLERAPEHCHRLMVAERVSAMAPRPVLHLHPAAQPDAQPRLL